MKNIRLFDEESVYHTEKGGFEFPTVSYTKDTDKVWYMSSPESIPYEITSWFVDEVTEDNYDCGRTYEVKYSTLFDFIVSYYEANKYEDEYGDIRCDASEFTFFGSSGRYINYNSEFNERIQMYMDNGYVHSVYLYRNRPNIVECECPVE